MGTSRTNVSLSTIYRILERKLRRHQKEEELFAGISHKAFADQEHGDQHHIQDFGPLRRYDKI